MEFIGVLLGALDAAGLKGLANAKLPAAKGKKKEAKAVALQRLEEGALAVKLQKGKSVLWFAARHAPSPASAALALQQNAMAKGPVVWGLADLKKLLLPVQKSHLAAALESLVQSGQVLSLKSVNGRSRFWIFREALSSVSAPVQPHAPSSMSPPPQHDGEPLRAVYTAWRSRSGSSLMAIQDLQHTSGLPLTKVHQWLRQEAAAGRAELSEGDWSLAPELVREAALVVGGQKFIRVRLHENS